MRDDDDLAPLLDDYFTSGAARADMEATMGSIKRSVDINDREVRMRFAKISKASWAELYFDLYRQCFGENASEEDCMLDAEHRLQTLKANFPERYGTERANEEWSDQDSRFITPAIDLDAHNMRVLDAAYGTKE